MGGLSTFSTFSTFSTKILYNFGKYQRNIHSFVQNMILSSFITHLTTLPISSFNMNYTIQAYVIVCQAIIEINV